MSQYTIQQIETRDELEQLVDVAWKAWWDPYLPNIRIALPIPGNLAGDRERGIIASKERIYNDYSKSHGKNKTWLCAKSPAGEVVGGVILDFAEGSPFPNGCPRLDLYWWPKGEEVKAFCQEMMQQVYTPRSLWMQRPHGGMSNFIVHPAHRGRGVGTLLLKYQTQRLDERGIEGFVEATEAGRPAYEKVGYQVVMKVSSFIPAGKSDEWLKWYHEMGISPWYAMWRPKHGQVTPGERTKPWQQGVPLPV